MTDLAPVDGRNVRRERNISSVLDVVMELFAENALFPSMEQVAERSGLSLRSLYRYFADPAELLQAAIKRHHRTAVEASHLSSIGEGPLGDRIKDFAAMRVRLYDRFGPAFDATLANAARHGQVHSLLMERRADQRQQFDMQFAPELGALPKKERVALAAAGDVLTQLESVRLMISYQGLTKRQAEDAIAAGLRALLGA